MKVSIFTPTHDTRYLCQLYDSIKDQPFYEWVILYNGGAKVIDFNDDRIKPIIINNHIPYVGALKHTACEYCSGDILLEVDHDDLLMPNAISEVILAFERDSNVGFVYSNCANFQGNIKSVDRYSEEYGWRYRNDTYFKGHIVDEVVAFDATPSSVSRIWFAPNHLRAWRSDIYWAVGGHNSDMRVLDDQELMSRTYSATMFYHIDKCLYLYRIHGDNVWLQNNSEIQNNVMRIYDKYIYSLCEQWSNSHGLLKLDLGGRFDCPNGWNSVDLEGADTIADLNTKWPFEDNSVGVIRAHDIFEHLKDPIFTMEEIYRVLVPGGYLLSMTPSTDGRGAFQDPTHCSFWNENSFLYYTNKNQAKYINTPVRFQSMRLYTGFPSDWHIENKTPYVYAHLISMKDGHRPPGIINI